MRVPVVVIDNDYRCGAAPRLVLQRHSACRFKLILKCSVLSLHSLDAGDAKPSRRGAGGAGWTGCRTARKVGKSSCPTTIGRRQSWSWKPWVPVEAGVHGAHAIQDFKTSACSSQAPHLPRLTWQEGILTLKSFIIPYLKLGDLPSDLAGGLAVISYSISWTKSCLIHRPMISEHTDIMDSLL